MDAELGIDLDEQVDVIRHDLEFDQFGSRLVGYGLDDRLEPFVYPIDQDRTTKLGAPHDVVLAGIDDVSVALILHT